MDINTNNHVNSANGRSAIDYHKCIVEHDTILVMYNGRNLRFQCICDQVFLTSKVLEKHFANCINLNNLNIIRPTIGFFRCGKCRHSTDSTFKIAQHYSRCSNAGAASNVESQAVTSESSDPSAQPQLKCSFCPRVFPTKIGKGQHERHTHANERALVQPSSRIQRWSDSELNLIVEAEAVIRLNYLLPEKRIITEIPLLDKIMLYLEEEHPHFDKSKYSVQGRRSHGREAEHYNAVLAKMRCIRSERASWSDTLDISNSDTIVDESLLEEDISQPNACPNPSPNCQKCECFAELERRIKARLETIVVHGGVSNQKKFEFFRDMVADLENFNVPRFRHISGLAPLTAKSNAPSTSHSATVGSGDRTAKKRSECGKIRDILDTQGTKRCLQYLRNPTSSGKCSRETLEIFKQLFEGRVIAEDEEGFRAKPSNNSHKMHKYIEPSEVKAQLKRIRKHTAPGLDQICVEQLSSLQVEDLVLLFNIFLLKGDVPKAMKINRTTMIPKSSNPGVGDWRPITVASLLDRLFAKILEARLSTVVSIDPNQRGFIRFLDGCGENITAYNGALRYSRKGYKPLVIVSLDFAKAFDSVQHCSIKRALMRLSVDKESIDLIMNLCKGQITQIAYDGGVENVELKCGVRQGWPLSPLLFLCVIDELLDLMSTEDGFKVSSPSGEEAYLTGCAFADDVILYSSSPTGMRCHLKKAEAWCGKRAMRIDPKKSSCLYLERVPRKKLVKVSSLKLLVCNDEIPCVKDSFERVLGVHIQYTGKVDHKTDDFSNDLGLVCRSQLRPSQKLTMIRECLLPMIKFRLVYGFASLGSCAQVDRIVRKAVKDIMHLPKWTADSAIYSSRKEGGLGLKPLKENVLFDQANLVVRMQNSSNAVTRLLACTDVLRKVYRRHVILGHDFSTNRESIDRLKQDLSNRKRQNFLSTTQGDGWSMFYKAPRLFLDSPHTRNWSDKDAIEATKMRCNLLVTRASTARTVGRGSNMDTSCRGCNAHLESQAHILSKCPTTQSDRVARHNAVCSYLVQTLRRKYESDSDGNGVHAEFSVRIKPGECEGLIVEQELRPDIAVVTTDCITLIEVSVVYETGLDRTTNSLEAIRRKKLDKYRPLRQVLGSRTGKRVILSTMIVGCRGGWIPSNNKVFYKLSMHLSEQDKNCIVERAVRGSIITYKRFLRRFYGPLISYNRNDTQDRTSSGGRRPGRDGVS